MGIAFRWSTSSGRAILLGFALSLLIESLQLWVPGRHTSLGDLAANTTGAALGVLAFDSARSALWPPRGRALALAVCWLVFASTALSLGRWLLGPDLAGTTYYAHWTPEREHLEIYDGSVVAARLNDVPLPRGRLHDPELVGARLRQEGAPLQVTAVAGRPPAGVAPIFSISDQRMHDVVTLGADGYDLVFRYRSRAARLLLDQPDLRFPGALISLAPGDSMRLLAEPGRRARTYRFAVNGSHADARFTVADTWGLLLWPRAIARRPALRRALGALWLAALVAPAVWWLAVGLMRGGCCAGATDAPRVQRPNFSCGRKR